MPPKRLRPASSGSESSDDRPVNHTPESLHRSYGCVHTLTGSKPNFGVSANSRKCPSCGMTLRVSPCVCAVCVECIEHMTDMICLEDEEAVRYIRIHIQSYALRATRVVERRIMLVRGLESVLGLMKRTGDVVTDRGELIEVHGLMLACLQAGESATGCTCATCVECLQFVEEYERKHRAHTCEGDSEGCEACDVHRAAKMVGMFRDTLLQAFEKDVLEMEQQLRRVSDAAQFTDDEMIHRDCLRKLVYEDEFMHKQANVYVRDSNARANRIGLFALYTIPGGDIITTMSDCFLSVDVQDAARAAAASGSGDHTYTVPEDAIVGTVVENHLGFSHSWTLEVWCFANTVGGVLQSARNCYMSRTSNSNAEFVVQYQPDDGTFVVRVRSTRDIRPSEEVLVPNEIVHASDLRCVVSCVTSVEMRSDDD